MLSNNLFSYVLSQAKHCEKLRDQVVNTVSSATASGHLAADMGLSVSVKTYAFGVAFERVRPQHINPRFRILLASEEFLEQV